ncbi:MAG: hypothetical protein GXP01_06680 [Alphaproteobacteria bacterium]|nr:hypothetical protein [Alphaproteobacteria bacterium]
MKHPLRPSSDPEIHRELIKNVGDPVLICDRARTTLNELVEITSRETVLLRSGQLLEAGELSAGKTRLAQEFVHLARTVQHNAGAIKAAAPEALARLKAGHAALATQMAENLKVLGSAKTLAQNLLADVARRTGKSTATTAYGRTGTPPPPPGLAAKGISIDQSL